MNKHLKTYLDYRKHLSKMTNSYISNLPFQNTFSLCIFTKMNNAFVIKVSSLVMLV